MNATERFLRYAAIPTRSDPDSTATPSTDCQFSLARLLADELTALGLTNVRVTDNCFVYAALPATPGLEGQPCLGLIAHMDTAPDYPGEGVKPQLHPDYDGGDIVLSATGAVLSPARFPSLNGLKGKTLITTDGSTLLGADDKAGVAEIMTAAAWLLAHPEIPHGKIRIGFTPDEEIGRGVDFFDVKRFGARFAYTVDGGFEGELEYENFNAASARIVVQGRNIHPGYAKDKMINALQVACEINSLLPAVQRPEHTQDYEGFYHLVGLSGTVEKASMEYIVRDHSRELFEEKKRFLADAVALLSRKYGEGTISLTVKDQYYNMREQVEPYPEVIGKAMQAMREAGVEPVVRPIRGGTDGARLSYMGLPCPNLFTGGMNFHGKFEYCSLDTMGRAVRTILNLARLWAE